MGVEAPEGAPGAGRESRGWAGRWAGFAGAGRWAGFGVLAGGAGLV